MKRKLKQIRITPELEEFLIRIAEQRGETFNGVVVRMLWSQIEKETGQKAFEMMAKGNHNDIELTAESNQSDFVLMKTDERHGLVRQVILDLHRKTFGVLCQWGPEESGQLAYLLRGNPGWTLQDMKRMLENRFMSEGATAERPMLWLGNLGKYAGGRLDRYGKTIVPEAKAPQLVRAVDVLRKQEAERRAHDEHDA